MCDRNTFVLLSFHRLLATPGLQRLLICTLPIPEARQALLNLPARFPMGIAGHLIQMLGHSARAEQTFPMSRATAGWMTNFSLLHVTCLLKMLALKHPVWLPTSYKRYGLQCDLVQVNSPRNGPNLGEESWFRSTAWSWNISLVVTENCRGAGLGKIRHRGSPADTAEIGPGCHVIQPSCEVAAPPILGVAEVAENVGLPRAVLVWSRKKPFCQHAICPQGAKSHDMCLLPVQLETVVCK